ncbi:MAG: sigma-70 family RNA polymerase sigma factor [Methylovulum sp.]|uniref:sigma-70 family RNA polymerase sigma factor n=1 Tax=Methylovulum sp. TaxID=1916980 RepID=UPI002621DC16|nr:sigma-70 family RNA polymerase sigma factor [Methylovulum sp.]MDD2724612.1 sigma-70 family RNA polymerase sigma factor [Methylovulum sp.]MDD5123361.1 sigma-70 family RNA polymerase sigma factor [Methylovulum sp.]
MNGYSGTERDKRMDNGLADVQDDSVSAFSTALPDAGEQQLQSLIERIMEQDQQAFAALYGQLLERVYGLALRITRHAQLAEEVTEDAFWQVWRQAPRFDAQRGGVVVWVMTIARSRALDALRRQDAVECEEATETTNLAGDNPQDLLSATEESSRVHDALAQLDPLPRQLVALAFFRGLSHDEIARHMDLPLGTVKSHIRRALLSLKQTLATAADY